MAEDVQRKVRDLKRKHQESVVRNGSEADAPIFWSKKVERDFKHHRQPEMDDDDTRMQREAELERVRARREQNEAEFARRQDDIGELERRRLAAEAVKEAAKEEIFHLKQNIGRAQKRLDEDRAQPIDELIRVLYLQDSHPFRDPQWQPHHVLNGFRAADARVLLQDVEDFQSLDVEDEQHVEYWRSIVALLRMCIEDELAATGASAAATVAAGTAIQPVADLVEQALQGSLEELNELQEEVQAELRNPQCPDPEYWTDVSHKLQRKKAERLVENIAKSKRVAAQDRIPASHASASGPAVPVGPEPDTDAVEGAEVDLPDWLQQSDGRFSPPLLPEDAVEGEVVTAEDDKEMLMALRAQVQQEAERAAAENEAKTARPPAGLADHRPTDAGMQQAIAAMGDSADELNFRGVVPLDAQEYWWQQQYVPRQPKFFNKVHTGYDWNKYNRAHYDQDNPPPKVVQGYKFNIFYPDLIDKSKAPKYKILPDPTGDDSTVILQFSAGAPYEDVAFRIVNKEWDRGDKKGYKNVFDRGMLQLYFNFKRTPYKR